MAGDALSPVRAVAARRSRGRGLVRRAAALGRHAGRLRSSIPAPAGAPSAGRWSATRQSPAGLPERGLRVLVNAGPGEEALADAIVKEAGGAAIPLSCSLSQLIALTRRIALCVAGDTGPLHLACALGRPVVGIYGPTDPSRNGPFGTRSECCAVPESRRDHSRRAEPEAGLLTITARRRAARRRRTAGRGERPDDPALLCLQRPSYAVATGSPRWQRVARRIRVPLGFLTAALYLFELMAARAPAGGHGLEPGAGAARPVAARLRLRLCEEESRADHHRPLRVHPQPALSGLHAHGRRICRWRCSVGRWRWCWRSVSPPFMFRSSPRRSAFCAPPSPDSTPIAAACPV